MLIIDLAGTATFVTPLQKTPSITVASASESNATATTPT
jgi:hypothetical protein